MAPPTLGSACGFTYSSAGRKVGHIRRERARQGQEVVSFTASGAELELLGEPKYVEEDRP